MRLAYDHAMENAEHLLALGEDVIYLSAHDAYLPWDKADDIECGNSYRFNGPASFWVIAHESGLTFKWAIDFEGLDANGFGVSMFERDRLRDVTMKLPLSARKKLADFLTDKVLPDLSKRTAEIRASLNNQLDSEDCVRGLIAFALTQED